MTRVMVIGLDGATFDLLDRMGRDRPNVFDEVKERGCHGVLETIFPPLTAPAWISFQAGRNPGKHGVFDFQRYTELGKGEIHYVSTDDIKAKTFYERLDEEGKRCIIVQMPVSYPPRIEETMVTGFMSGKEGHVFPPSLTEEVDFSKYEFFLLQGIKDGPLATASREEQFVHLREVVRERFNIGLALLEREWDFYFFMFSVTDHISHMLYHKVLEGAGDGETRAAMEILHDIEGYIRRMMEAAGEDVNVLFMSDHGFDSYQKRFLVNTWLYRNGYLREGKDDEDIIQVGKGKEGKRSMGGLPRAVSRVPGVRNVAQVLYRRWGDRLNIEADARLTVDIEGSQAFCPSYTIRGIFINDERFHGLVKGEDVKGLRDEIIGKLRAEGVFRKVLAKEDFYQGDNMAYAPDILLFEDDSWISPELLLTPTLVKDLRNDHSLDGILLAVGPDMAEGRTLERSSLMDVAPTILHMFGLPVDEDMDGKVVTQAFRPGSDPAAREVEYISEGPYEPVPSRSTRSEEEEDEIRERLRGLGYLG
jgi:predicted AlkP superfamily phosphohydrolase/phosphomutase